MVDTQKMSTAIVLAENASGGEGEDKDEDEDEDEDAEQP